MDHDVDEVEQDPLSEVVAGPPEDARADPAAVFLDAFGDAA